MNISTLISYIDFAEMRRKKALPSPMFTKVKKIGQYSVDKEYSMKIESILISTHEMEDLTVGSIDNIPDELKNFTVDAHNFILEKLPNYNLSVIDYKSIDVYSIIKDKCIYLICASSDFGKCRLKYVEKLLVIYCLHKSVNTDINSVGLILPCHGEIVKVDISKWNWKPLLEHIVICIPLISVVSDSEVLEYKSEVEPHLGYHVKKSNGSVAKSLMKNKHCQIFISSPRGGNISIPESDVIATKESKRDFYIHAPYYINLSNDKSDQYDLNSLIDQLKYGVKMGSKGVVVHLGKLCKREKDICVDVMKKNLIVACKFATVECPLLLETGAGIEILSDVNELCVFYNSLPQDTRDVMKICLDTCHVFVSGFQPNIAVDIFIKTNVPIGLIHFNGSEKPFGSCKDRHAPALNSMIPLKSLIQVAKYAIENKIHLIVE